MMTCSHCIMHIKEAAKYVGGVEVKDINLDTKNVTFSLESPDKWITLKHNLEEMGYPAEEI
jgi:copper chaperone CopZ